MQNILSIACLKSNCSNNSGNSINVAMYTLIFFCSKLDWEDKRLLSEDVCSLSEPASPKWKSPWLKQDWG